MVIGIEHNRKCTHPRTQAHTHGDTQTQTHWQLHHIVGRRDARRVPGPRSTAVKLSPSCPGTPPTLAVLPTPSWP